MTEVFNLGRAIYEVRALEAKCVKEQDELDKKQAQSKDYIKAKRTEILEHLNATGQKSANTEFGGAYWKPKITYRVEDKDEFRRHVIGMEQWGLLSWAAASVACEDFTNEHEQPPPGLVRNAVNILYVTAPDKKATKAKAAE